MRKYASWIFRPARMDSSGIFDGNIKAAPGKTLRETTKELVETLKADAIKYQGHAFRILLSRIPE